MNQLANTQQQKFHLFYNGPFCQWYRSPFTVNGVQYTCAEQYMMAQKARLFLDDVSLAKIMATDSPSEQKALGKRVKGFVKEQWEAVARDVVMRGSLAKFTSSIELYTDLLETEGTLLVEASPTDRIWGIGLSEYDEDCHDVSKWRGTNWLGQVLTDLREMLILARDAEHMIG
jgi:ribA/ribD-fused uncharacterized protein